MLDTCGPRPPMNMIPARFQTRISSRATHCFAEINKDGEQLRTYDYVAPILHSPTRPGRRASRCRRIFLPALRPGGNRPRKQGDYAFCSHSFDR